MRLCHISDSHLGAGENHERRGRSGLTLRQEDILNSFVEAVDRIITLKPDFCIHSGDLFDKVRPLNRIMAMAGEALHKLTAEAGIPTVIILGNHDAPKQPFMGAAIDVYRQFANLHIVSGPGMEQVRIGDCAIMALPHCLTSEILKRELQRCRPNPDCRYNVLVMHGVAAGMSEFSMADLGEQELPLEVMAPFDYVALGHYHNFRQVSPRAWYAGSTERLSQAERETAKGFAEITLEPFNVEFHEVATRTMIDAAPIMAEGKRGDELAQLLKERLASVDSSDKIVRVNIEGVTAETLKTLPAGLIAELKQRSFDLNIHFQRPKETPSGQPFGRAAIGKLEAEFGEYLATVDLAGFDKERLLRKAARLLSDEE
ncbi:MAG: exonuclease SbcCD subunit D [Candidatus Zixiibacteriota bacterium]